MKNLYIFSHFFIFRSIKNFCRKDGLLIKENLIGLIVEIERGRAKQYEMIKFISFLLKKGCSFYRNGDESNSF